MVHPGSMGGIVHPGSMGGIVHPEVHGRVYPEVHGREVYLRENGNNSAQRASLPKGNR